MEINGRRYKCPLETLQAWARDGRVTRSTFVWKPGMQHFVVARNVPELAAALPKDNTGDFMWIGLVVLGLVVWAPISYFMGYLVLLVAGPFLIVGLVFGVSAIRGKGYSRVAITFALAGAVGMGLGVAGGPPTQNAPAQPPAVVARCGEPPAENLHGTYFVVDDYLAQHLNDPDSYDPINCSPPVATKACYLTTCRFRAKNGFGAKIVQTFSFTIDHGKVTSAVPLQ